MSDTVFYGDLLRPVQLPIVHPYKYVKSFITCYSLPLLSQMLMLDMSHIEDNAMVPDGLKWLPVIGNVSGFLLILGTVYLLRLFLWPRVSPILSEYVLMLAPDYVSPLGNRHAPNNESDTSNSSPDLSRAASPSPPHYTASSISPPPPPYTASPSPSLHTEVSLPSRRESLRRERQSHQPRTAAPRHADELVARAR
ncbi:hypothetical protein K503DRAFT_133648 [Rhizopogon vinicolor AM-OR11-026]|uniref:Uncharacterized protein n=1 Tax=Rhizopogon vinicolor AM-OR11-026 TaxID=1314800 RepID=A0A1B7N1S9_9AGAM|nr:hypothetical protein K503DRAFT_133648 [Rhizopogon vinicolor AM-OR11-026]